MKMPRARLAPAALTLTLVAGLLVAGGSSAAEVLPATGQSARSTVSYEPSSRIIVNPERGFYRHTETHYHADGTGYSPLNLNTLRNYRDNEQISQILRVVYMEKFATQDRLDQAWLDLLAADFATARAAGVSVVVRFAYSRPAGGFPYQPPFNDAPLDRVLSHIEQLTPVLRANSDVIATVQAGFIGLWGEWYYTDHFVADPNNPGQVTDQDWANRRAVVLALLDALPPERTVQVRTMRMKQRIFDRPSGTAGALTADEAFTGSDVSRVGHHNDCFLASADDFGTFLSNPISLDQDYLAQETQYVPMGGETCNVNPPRSEWPTASAEMERYHYSYLNVSYNQNVLNSWGAENLDETRRKLGYRFTLAEGTFSDGVRPGTSFDLSLDVRNDGWAAPYNERGVELILQDHRHTFVAELDADPRRWAAGETTAVDARVCVRGIPHGEYSLYLNLPSAEPSLADRPEYSIRFANEDMWIPDRGWNDLAHTMTISPREAAGGDCAGTATLRRVVSDDPPAQGRAPIQADYEPTDENIINPERGFSQFGTHPLSLNSLNTGRNNGRSVFGMMVNLNNFRGAPISDTFLDAIQTSFDNVRTAGVKVKLRFRYDSTAAGQDAPLELVLEHIEQLTPLLQANADVIMHMDAGFIGAWGEWHSSQNGLINHWEDHFGEEINDATRAITAAVLDALPEERMIAVRTPRYKWQLFDEENLSDEEAFTGTDRARVGVYNDCFLSNETDWGTYAERQPELDWLNTEARYTPMAGETCSADEEAQPYIACPNALHELDYTHWNALNISWNPAVYSHWEATGCMEEVRRKLGYRFVLESAQVSRSAPVGESIGLRLTLRNDGFASPFNARPVEAVLRNTATGAEHRFALDADPRRWWGGEAHVVDQRITIPAGVAPGEYALLLNLPDAAPTLRADPRYSVRVANTGTWEAGTGFNDLGLTVVVTG